MNRMLRTMALMETDLPVPVAPATNKWGMRAKSVTKGPPPVSLPNASVSLESLLWYASLSITSLR